MVAIQSLKKRFAEAYALRAWFLHALEKMLDPLQVKLAIET